MSHRNEPYWQYAISQCKEYIAFSIIALFVLTRSSCYGVEISYKSEIFLQKTTDTLRSSPDRLADLEVLILKNTDEDKNVYQKHVSEYVHLAVQYKEYERATGLLITVLERFQSFRALPIYLELCHLVVPFLSADVMGHSNLPKFYLSMGNAYRGLRRKEEQILYYSKVIDLNSTKDSLSTAQALFIRGQSYSWSGKFLNALEDYVLSAEYFNRLNDPFGAINVEEGVLLLLRRNGFGKEIIPRRLRLIEKIKDLKKQKITNKFPITLPLEYLNLASDYQVDGNLDQYEHFLLKALEEVQKEEYSQQKFEYLYITCYAELADLYLKKDLKIASKYLQKSGEYITPGRYPKNTYHLLLYTIKKVKFLVAFKKYTEAIQILETLLKSTSIREVKQLSEIYKLMSNIYSIKRQDQKALTYYLLFQNLNDSIFSVSKTNSLAYYQTLYDSEKKEKEIVNQELSIASQESIIATQGRQQGYFVIGLFVLLIVLLGVFFFIKRIRTEKRKVAESLFEKELLLKEIHHRVKNNLQIVYGLLYKQSRVSDDRAFKNLMEDAQSRIKSMAIIHEKLYRNNSFSEIDMKGYVSELIKDIDRSYTTDSNINVTLQMTVTKFHIDIAIPLGLILNELISNVYKHAFPSGKGNMWISLTQYNGQHQITVKDDGVGVPEGLDFNKSSSLGMNLVTGLCHQIRASFDYQNNTGSEFTIVLNDSL